MIAFSQMKILVSNDDGYQSPGIRILADYLRLTAEVTVVASEATAQGHTVVFVSVRCAA